MTRRIRRNVPRGAFAHLRAIHRHLFQDIYDWAGELRMVEISKGSQQFQFRKFIPTGMADVHRRLVRSRLLSGLPSAEFAAQAAVIIGDINYIHPFREGNGGGHGLDLTRFNGPRWLAASISSHAADYGPMTAAILEALEPRPDGR